MGSISTAPAKSPVESVAFASREPQIGAYKALVLAPSWPQISAGFTRADLRPLFRTRLRVLRAEREWSHAKLAASNVSLRRIEAHFRIEANGLASSQGDIVRRPLGLSILRS